MTVVTFNDSNDCYEYFEIVAEPSNRATTETNLGFINYLESLFKSGASSLTVLEDDYKLIFKGVVFLNYSPFLETYNEMLGWMEDFGFMAYWRKRFVEDKPIIVEEIGPQVLTMDHLGIGFLACCIPLVFCIATFIGELIYSRFQQKFDRRYRKQRLVRGSNLVNIISTK